MTDRSTLRASGFGNKRRCFDSRALLDVKEAKSTKAAVKLKLQEVLRERKSSVRLEAALERPFRNATSPKQNKSLHGANKGQRQ